MNVAVMKPEPPPPRDGWPVVLLLHGYGSNHASLAAIASELSRRGFAAIALDGPIALGGDGFQWPTDSAGGTHVHLQAALKTVSGPLDRGRVLLFGFSQGALHAFVLLATEPRYYHGALCFAPGGWLELPSTVSQPERSRPLLLSYGVDELPGTVDTVLDCRRLWTAAGFPLVVSKHSQGHDVPDNWPNRWTELLALG